MYLIYTKSINIATVHHYSEKEGRHLQNLQTIN